MECQSPAAAQLQDLAEAFRSRLQVELLLQTLQVRRDDCARVGLRVAFRFLSVRDEPHRVGAKFRAPRCSDAGATLAVQSVGLRAFVHGLLQCLKAELQHSKRLQLDCVDLTLRCVRLGQPASATQFLPIAHQPNLFARASRQLLHQTRGVAQQLMSPDYLYRLASNAHQRVVHAHWQLRHDANSTLIQPQLMHWR